MTTALPASAVPETVTPLAFSEALMRLSPPTLLMVGWAGALVSRAKDVLAAATIWGFPAASVAVAETLMVPLPRAVRSAEVRTTGTAVAPLPVTVLLTVPPAEREKVTATEAPDSAVRVITPPAA